MADLVPSPSKAKRGERTPDPEVVLDQKGWVRISVNRFYWDGDRRPNEKQLAAIKTYMAVKKMTAAVFNSATPMSFEEGTKED